MSEPIHNDSEIHEHRRLVDRIALLAGPRDLADVSDAELEAMLDAFSDVPSSSEQTEAAVGTVLDRTLAAGAGCRTA